MNVHIEVEGEVDLENVVTYTPYMWKLLRQYNTLQNSKEKGAFLRTRLAPYYTKVANKHQRKYLVKQVPGLARSTLTSTPGA